MSVKRLTIKNGLYARERPKEQMESTCIAMVAMHWEKYFQHVVGKYNRIYRAQLPKITPHVCRHTYCFHMAKSGMNPQVLQYLMGHSDISVTLNTYTHLKLDDAKEEIDRLTKVKETEIAINSLEGKTFTQLLHSSFWGKPPVLRRKMQ